MPDKKKMIQINPDFFKMGKKTKQKKQKKQKPDFRQTIKPNNIKKQLLAKIKAHQQKEKDLQKQQRESEVEKFTDDFNSSLNYLNSMIKEKKQKKLKKTRKKNKFTNKHSVESAATNFNNQLSTQIHTEPFIEKNNFDNIVNTQNKPNLVSFNKNEKHGINKESKRNSNQANIDQNNINKNTSYQVAPDPPYGCLKNGTKPTYNQYMKTLKKDKIHKPRPTLMIHDNSLSKKPLNKDVLERKEKLKQLKTKIAQPKKVKSTRTVKIKKTIKIFKLGKKDGKVGVLVRSAQTRKKVKNEHKILHNKCLGDVKRYLRKHNLIKAGTSAPESVIRGIYENSFLAGEIYNKNADLLLHNYVNNED